MKKVMVSLKAEVEYSVVVEVPDNASDDEILHEAETYVDHDNDKVDFIWHRNGSWSYDQTQTYEIEEYED